MERAEESLRPKGFGWGVLKSGASEPNPKAWGWVFGLSRKY